MLMGSVIGVQAQDNLGLAFAGVQDGQLTLFGLGDAPLVVNNPPNKGISSIVWSPDGTKLAYILYDEQFQTHVMVADVTAGADPLMLDAGPLEAAFPLIFTADGQIIYIGQGTQPADTSQPYRSDVKRIAPEAGATPETLSNFEMGIGCGGGASIPTFWQYWEEAGFSGSGEVLKQTDFGLLHSTNCSGSGLALLNLETGADTKIGPDFSLDGDKPTEGSLGRVTLSPDGKTAAAIRTRSLSTNVEPFFTHSLALIDLATLNVTDVSTLAQPDQVAWSRDGATLFYSVQENPINLVEGLSPEEQQKIAPIVGTVQDGALVPLWSYTATIHQVNPSSGQDNELYSADAYAIGRMAATPDGQALIASQVANAKEWMMATLDGTLTAQTDPNGSMARALVPVTLYRIPLNAGEAPTVIGENLAQFVLRPTRQ